MVNLSPQFSLYLVSSNLFHPGSGIGRLWMPTRSGTAQLNDPLGIGPRLVCNRFPREEPRTQIRSGWSGQTNPPRTPQSLTVQI